MVHKNCDLEYTEQVTAEHKITERSKGKVVQRWGLKASHAANHYLDCEVYAAAAADVLEVRSMFLQNPESAAEKPPEKAAQPPRQETVPEETWIRQNEETTRTRGACMVHKNCDLEYTEQVTAEHKITERSKGKVVQRWGLKASHSANHYRFCCCDSS